MSSTTTTNQLLDGRYRIICALGSGGMGQTYIAEDVRRPNNSKCVIKQLKPANHDPNFLVTARRLFRNEAVILESLGKECDRIPELLAYFEQDQEFYLVQNFVDGQPLTTEMQIGDRWSEAQVIQLLEEVLSILEVVHAQGVIHRDIKPDNLIRRPDGKLVLIDFGAVKQVRQDHLTTPGMISMTVGLGTPGYMPNEQSNGKPRPSSDLFALGMVAIQALTGMLPSQLRDDDEGEFVWREQANVSEELGNFLTKMVRYHFKHRYETATDALQALRRLQSSTTSSFRPKSVDSAVEPESLNHDSATTMNTPKTTVTQSVDPSQDSQRTYSSIPTELLTPLQTESRPASSSSPKKSIWIGAGLAVTTIGLLASAGYLYVQSQQTQALERIQQSYTSDRFDECMTQATIFPGYHSELYTKAQTISGNCQVAKTQQATLQEIEQLKTDGQYEAAINKAKALTDPQSKFYTETQQLLGESQLALAKQLAKNSSLEKAINVLTEISPDTSDTSVKNEAQKLMSQWSERIYSIAEEKYVSAKDSKGFEEALRIAKAVPQDSSAYQKAQTAVQRWGKEEKKNRNDHWRAEEALKRGDWDTARTAASQLMNSPVKYWRESAQAITNQANEGEQKERQPIDVQGTLAPNESGVLLRSDDHTLFRDYDLQGKKGERLMISLVGANNFDTRLYLISPDKQEIELSDDINASNRNSSLIHDLTQTGTYQVRVSAYHRSDIPAGQGQYHLTVYRETNK